MTLEEYVRDSLSRWISGIEGYLVEAGAELPAELEKLAAGYKDRALADWVRDHGKPQNIRRDVELVRHKMRSGDLVGGLRAVERFETSRRFMEQLLNRPYLVTGRSFKEGPKKPRADALARLIDEALERLGSKAKSTQVLDYVRADTQTVQETDDEDRIIWWRDNRGREKKTTYKTFFNRIARRRKKTAE